jgi:hypothetical protein
MRATLSRHIARGQAAEIPEKQKADSERRAYWVFSDPQNHVHRDEQSPVMAGLVPAIHQHGPDGLWKMDGRHGRSASVRRP